MDPAFKRDLGQSAAILRAMTPFIQDNPLHAQLLREHGGIDVSDLKAFADSHARAISIQTMSLPERREIDPEYKPATPPRDHPAELLAAIERTIDELEPAPEISETRNRSAAQADSALDPADDLQPEIDAAVDIEQDVDWEPDYDIDWEPLDVPDYDRAPEREIRDDRTAADALPPHYDAPAHAAPGPELDARGDFRSPDRARSGSDIDPEIPAEREAPQPEHASSRAETRDMAPTPAPTSPTSGQDVRPSPGMDAPPGPSSTERVEDFHRRLQRHCQDAADAGLHPLDLSGWTPLERELRALAKLPDLAPGDSHFLSEQLKDITRDRMAREQAETEFNFHVARREEFDANNFGRDMPPEQRRETFDRLRQEGLALADNPALSDSSRMHLLATCDQTRYLEVQQAREAAEAERKEAELAARQDPQALYADHLERRDRHRHVILDPSSPARFSDATSQELRREARALMELPNLPESVRLDLLRMYEPERYLAEAFQDVRGPDHGREPSAQSLPAAQTDRYKSFADDLSRHVDRAKELQRHPYETPGWPELAERCEQLLKSGSLTPDQEAQLSNLERHHRAWQQEKASEIRMPFYAGVGARATPPETLAAMTTMSDWLAKRGWHLHSGGAQGADTAFAKGANTSARTVFVPWQGYNKQEGAEFVVPSPDVLDRAKEIAASLHPAWDRCKDSDRLLHARNAAIVLGPNLDTPVDALMCWTEDGKTIGGTGMAIRIAEKFDVPVFNLATDHPRTVCEAMMDIQEKASIRQDNSQATAGRQEEGLRHEAAGVETPSRTSPAETVSGPDVDPSSKPLATRSESRHANPTYPAGMIEARHADAILHGPSQPSPAPEVVPEPAPAPDTSRIPFFGGLLDSVRSILPGAEKAADTRYPEHAADTVPQLAEPATAFSPNHDTPDMSQAFTAMVDAAIPDTEENEAVRRTLFHRVVDAVHSTVAGPGGVEDQADRLYDRRVDLAREDYGSEIGVFQTLENEEKLENTLSAQDLLHNARATLAAVAEEQTGERWSPAPAPDSVKAKTITAASAEASEAIDRLKMDRDRARLPQQGTPIAIAAWNDNTDRETVRDVLDQTLKARPDMYIAHGNGHGTPELVAEWAQDNKIYQATFEPDQHRHGKQAVAERDRRLFQTVQPQIVIEFQGPKPTALAQEARKNNVTIWPVDDAKKQELRMAREARLQAHHTDESMHETLSTGKSAGMSM